jgi:hypothetical protein
MSNELINSMSTLNVNEEPIIFTPIPTPNIEALSEPFSYINDTYDGYNNDDFSEGLLDEDNCDASNFPNNITEYYWIHEGMNDEEPWECLCKLDNNNYAFYSAWCDYTGFDCQGGMKLIVSKDINRLFYEGLTDAQRRNYFKDTKTN